ncbi:TPA: hypothetical protein QDZ10_002265 [Stenotrophomonas maltophilia]|jgi:lauroyl/myristoyl acyltransferase|nr:hypothetical protein [Stenotrophomonas maltophilia]
MKKAFQRLSMLSVFVPLAAAADTASREAGYSAGYKLGWYVGWFIGTFGPYLIAAALVGVVGWLWFRRAKARRTRGDGS